MLACLVQSLAMGFRLLGVSVDSVPYGVRLLFHRVECTDVLPKLFIYPNHIFHSLNDRRAEVHGEVRIIVVTSGMPAFYPVIFVRFLVIYQRLDCDGVEVVGVPV